MQDSRNKPNTDDEFGEKKCEQAVEEVGYEGHGGERQSAANAGGQEVCDLRVA